MIELLLILGIGVVIWLLKQIVGPLIGQEIKGSVPDYAAGKARAAARLLPPDLAEEYEQDWLAELYVLKDKPLSALKYAHGLRRAARRISAGPTRRGLQLTEFKKDRRRHFRARFTRFDRVRIVYMMARFVLVLAILFITLVAVASLKLFVPPTSTLPVLAVVIAVLGQVVALCVSHWAPKPNPAREIKEKTDIPDKRSD